MPVTHSKASLPMALPTLVLAALTFCVLPASAVPPTVATQHNDNLRSGSNTQESILNLVTVNSKTFGKLYTLNLDASVNGQPLYVPDLQIKGGLHNVLFVYTSNSYNNNSPSSVYAFDADKPGVPLWRHQLPASAEWTTATPVIDVHNNLIYLVTKSTDDNGPTYMRALNLLTGAEAPGSPIQITASVRGTGDGSSGGIVSFDTTHANSRPGLLLLNGTVYCAFSHGSDSFPYHGWVFGYRYSGGQFTQTAVFCTNPFGGDDGVWHAGKGLVADAQGYIYCVVGNGTFDVDISVGAGIDYGMCYLKLTTPNLTVFDYFAGYDTISNSDADLDSSGAGALIIPGTNRLFGGATKFGSVFIIDTSRMGHYRKGPAGTDNVLQRFDNVCSDSNVGQNPIAWDTGTYKYIYLWPQGASLLQYEYDPSIKMIRINSPDGSYHQAVNDTTGGSLAVTSSGATGGILWAVGNDSVFRAFDATDISQPELWDSNIDASRDGLPSVGHFQFPTVVNGRAYVPTGAPSLAVYGILSTGKATTLIPTDNTYVEGGSSANTNFGGSLQLRVEKDAKGSGSASNRATYLKFDLTSVTTPATQALLRLKVNSASSPAAQKEQVQVNYVTTTSWTQAGLTWNNTPGLNRSNFTSMGVHVTTPSISTSATGASIDVTSLVNSHLGQVITLQLIDATAQKINLIFDSTAAGNTGPQLVITE